MATVRTEISEIVTGLGLFGYRDLERALAARPRSIGNVTDRVFDRLDAAFAEDKHGEIFANAFANGEVFARANVGLRGRVPWLIEWKGHHRPPAYEQIPADLRVDHVYLISCKYGSDILHNASPWHVFDKALAERSRRGGDWFVEVAGESYQEFYAQVRKHVTELSLPTRVTALNKDHRAALRTALAGRWPRSLRYDWELVGFEIARNSAQLLMERTSSRLDREELLWRLLRLAASPYFVLGTDRTGFPIRYRVLTPWDFRNRYRMRHLDMWGDYAGQPTVRWRAEVVDKQKATLRTVEGHVEIRWSHGKFAGVPEAKIYLDTPHHDVVGYEPIDSGN